MPLPTNTVRLRFNKLLWPDMEELSATLRPFGAWHEDDIIAEMPVVVEFPEPIIQRIATLKGFLYDNKWPIEPEQSIVESVRSIIESEFPSLENVFKRAIRLMAAGCYRDDGSRAVQIRDKTLETFFASKMFATFRALAARFLKGEPLPNDFQQFVTIEYTFSDNLINGLSYLSSPSYRWAGWTDADIYLCGDRMRIWAPVFAHPDTFVSPDDFSENDLQALIFPQLLTVKQPFDVTYGHIQELIFTPWKKIRHFVRSEQFVDAVSFREHGSREAIISRAAEQIIPALKSLPASEHFGEVVRLTSGCGGELQHLVIDRIASITSLK